MVKQSWNPYLCLLRQQLDVIVIVLLATIYFLFSQTVLRNVLSWLFLFIPGYSVTRLTVENWKNDFVRALTGVAVLSFCIDPLLGNLVQLVTALNSCSALSAFLIFSLPILIASNLRPKANFQENLENSKKPKIKAEVKEFLLGKAAFLGSLVIGLGLYAQASLGAVAPRGYDIYGHMHRVNGIVGSGRAPFYPDLNVLSNFYHIFYAEACLLTGLDVLTVSLVLQVLVGGILAMAIYYFAEYVTGSSVASFLSVVLFMIGPPLYGGVTPYFYYFHPMWVAFAIFPFALVYVHKRISQQEEKSVGLASIVVVALFLYHLVVGLMFASILLVDSLFLLKSRWKLLLPRLAKIVALTFLVSSFMIIPFVLNMSNPFKYVYTTGGFETLYSMFFGVSRYAYVSRGGWEFFGQYLQEFGTILLPLIVLGIPALAFLFLKRKRSFLLIFACMVVGLFGTFQPYIGIAFLPQRFTQPMIIFGATLASYSISRILAVPTIGFAKQGRVVRIKLGISKKIKSKATLLFVAFCSLLICTYAILYSPAQHAILEAELYITSNDLDAIEWIDKNLPEKSRIMMDQYLQFFATGITGRPRLYSITADEPLYKIWDVYPVNIYIGRTDPLEVDADYIVISRWCYTTWDFVGKEYFDQHGGLTTIYEHTFVYLNRTYTYAVYELIR